MTADFFTAYLTKVFALKGEKTASQKHLSYLGIDVLNVILMFVSMT